MVFRTRDQNFTFFRATAQIRPDFASITHSMSFAETYNHEVIETRRIRAQRARFWAKLISLLLMITIAAVLRSEPQLRSALMGAAVDGVTALRGETASAQAAPIPSGQTPGMAMADPEAVLGLLRKIQPGQQAVGPVPGTADPAMPQSPGFLTRTPLPTDPTLQINTPQAGSGIKVNRPTGHSGPRFQRVQPHAATHPPPATQAPALDIKSIANQIGNAMGGS